MERRQQQFDALGSHAFITLIAANTQDFTDLFTSLRNKIAAFEQRFSRFLPDSELTKFNKNAGNETSISDEFRDLLLASKNMARVTDDLYNPFILPALQKAGYKGSWPSPDKLAGAEDFSLRKITPSDTLNIFQNTASIPPDTAVDFGGIGKGYLLDQLSSFLQTQNIIGYWVSLGGDIVCAGHDLDDTTWSILVQHATKPEKTITSIQNKSGEPLFVATSGITKRRGDTQDGPWHHLINPKTGMPAVTNILTATVVSTSGVQADVFAKVIVINGEESAKLYKSEGDIHKYVLQLKDERTVTDA